MYLNAHSVYSQHYGTLTVAELVEAARAKGVNQLALTDINSAAGLGSFVRLAEENGIVPICGVEFRNDGELLYIGLARNADGVRELRNFLEQYQSRRLPFPELAPGFENVSVLYRYGGFIPETLRTHEYIGIRPGQLTELGRERTELWNKLVVRQPITFSNGQGYEVHKQMRRIGGPVPLSMLLSESVAHANERILTRFEFSLMFSRHTEVLENTERLLETLQPAYAAELDCLPVEAKPAVQRQMPLVPVLPAQTQEYRIRA